MLSGTSQSIYVRLSRSLFFFVLLAAVIPSLLQALIAHRECERMVEQEYRDRLVWQMRHTEEVLDAFLADHLAILRFLFGSHTLEEFRDQERMYEIFGAFKRQFPHLRFVDLGLIDSAGNQITYSGPHNIAGVNYAQENWFYEVVVRGSYITDVFLGHRKVPHILIALKSTLAGDGSFWILRATVNPEAFDRILGAMNSGDSDDAFIMDKNGILQSTSRSHGAVLDQFSLQIPSLRQDVVFTEQSTAGGPTEVIAAARLKNKDWILLYSQPLSVKERYLHALQNRMSGILLLSLAGVFVLALWITRNFVGRLKEAEEEHEAILHKIEHTNKLASIGRLAAGVAHEINNPLAIINEKAGLMKDLTEMSEDSAIKEKYLDLLGAIHSSVHRCRAITHRLLGFARQMDVTAEVIDVNALVREVLGFLEKEAFHRNVLIELDLLKHLPSIESDRGQLQQVFLNVVNNAMDAVTDGGRIAISTWITDDEMVAVKISDNGCGIPQDKLKRIFEPFFTTKGREKGTGLGLSITYGIINKLGGKVSVESEVNVGTTFVIELPRHSGA